jgi:hypothetical protein
VIAYRTLCESSLVWDYPHLIATSARQQFGSLQRSIFPVYFKLNAIISSGLLLAWIRNHDTVIEQIAYPTIPDVSQTYTLAVVVISQALNALWIGPVTSEYVTRQRNISLCLICSIGSWQSDSSWKRKRARTLTMPRSVSSVSVVRALLTLFKGVGRYEEAECEVREVAWV